MPVPNISGNWSASAAAAVLLAAATAFGAAANAQEQVAAAPSQNRHVVFHVGKDIPAGEAALATGLTASANCTFEQVEGDIFDDAIEVEVDGYDIETFNTGNEAGSFAARFCPAQS